MKNFLIRLSLSVAVFAVALIPVWIFLLVKHMFEPHGFWQNLALAGIGVWILGLFQVGLLVLAIFLLWYVWFELKFIQVPKGARVLFGRFGQ